MVLLFCCCCLDSVEEDADFDATSSFLSTFAAQFGGARFPYWLSLARAAEAELSLHLPERSSSAVAVAELVRFGSSNLRSETFLVSQFRLLSDYSTASIRFLLNLSAWISRFKDCPLCGADIEKIELDKDLQDTVDRFIEGHARIRRSQVNTEFKEVNSDNNKVIYEDVSLERGAFLVQQAMRAFRAQNILSF